MPSSLHLKSVVTRCGSRSLVIPEGYEGTAVRRRIENATESSGYEWLTVPDESAANCIFFQTTADESVLLHRSSTEFPQSARIFADLDVDHKIELTNSELAKADGALTCCSIIC